MAFWTRSLEAEMRYEKYKAFEYDWLPEIPAHWDSKQLRAYLSLADERKGDRKDLQLLSVYREYGVIPKNSRTDNNIMKVKTLPNIRSSKIQISLLTK